MKNYSKEVIRNQPRDLIEYSLEYFKKQHMIEQQDKENDEKNEYEKPAENLMKKDFNA